MSLIVTGVKEIDRALASLPAKVQRKVLRQAMRAGMKIVAEEARADAPVDTGRLKGAIKVRAAKSRRRGVVAVQVRIDSKAFQQGDDATDDDQRKEYAFYPAMVEFGSSERPAEPFMGPAFDAAGPKARQVAMNRIVEGVEREASQARV